MTAQILKSHVICIILLLNNGSLDCGLERRRFKSHFYHWLKDSWLSHLTSPSLNFLILSNVKIWSVFLWGCCEDWIKHLTWYQLHGWSANVSQSPYFWEPGLSALLASSLVSFMLNFFFFFTSLCENLENYCPFVDLSFLNCKMKELGQMTWVPSKKLYGP